jgi:hypothetical protein
MSQSMTFTPACDSAVAIPSPMPEAAPVTNVPTGVVDKDVEPTELSHNLLDAGIDRVRIALIQLYANASPADLLHGLDSRSCALRITHVRNRNVHARFSEASRYGAANIAGTSRDEGGLSTELHCATSIPTIVRAFTASIESARS